MSQDRVSGSLSADDRAAILEAIGAARARMPFLIDLTPDENRSLLRIGDKTEAFVRRALDVAERNPEMLPGSFDLEEMRADVDLYFQLQAVDWALTQFKELVSDTAGAVGEDAYRSALEIYNYAKLGSAEGLDELRELMRRRFNRSGSRSAAAPDDSATEPAAAG